MKFLVECELPLSARDMWRVRATAGFRRHVVEDGLLKRLDSSAEKKGDDGWMSRTQRYVPAKVDFPDFLRTVIGDAMFDVTDEQRFNDEERAFCQEFRIRPTMFGALSTTTGELTLRPVDAPETEVAHDGSDVSSEAGTDGTDCDSKNADEAENANAKEELSVSDPKHEEEKEEPTTKPSEFASLPITERCIHCVEGDTKVNVPTVGWLVERSIVANLRLFYSLYPGCLARFRQKLYDQFASGDSTVPCSVVIDRFLKNEEETESVSDGESASDMSAMLAGRLELDGMPSHLVLGDSPGLFKTSLLPGDRAATGLGDFESSPRTLEEDFESFFVSA